MSVPGWGGKRDGAGRPAILTNQSTIAVRVSAAQLTAIDKYKTKNGHKDRSETLRAIIDKETKIRKGSTK